jgi:beta-1,2-mannobiose phosphorylase / 1,2-beta-oligomannan phosphorylase
VPDDGDIPYRLTRVGTVMSPDPGEPWEAEGVLNPAAAHTPDGRLHLLPRLVAAGNVSRIGLAEVVIDDGVPSGVHRRGVVLAPDEGWERGAHHGGVEDPRVTFVERLGLHLMTYVAFGPLGPRIALAVSRDLDTWERLGPVLFAYQPGLDIDLNLYPNKDAVIFPEPMPGPGGVPSYAMLHRPMWDQTMSGLEAAATRLPAGLTDERPGIWISYVPAEHVEADIRALTLVRDHRCVALPERSYESAKIGAGPPPVRVPEGWLLIHHGVEGEVVPGFDPSQQGSLVYRAGAMLLDPGDPSRVIARTAQPLLGPETVDERVGTVPNVVFPTAIATIDGRDFVFYGMADSSIGAALLERTQP